MEADRAHVEIQVRVLLAAELLGHGEAVEASLVGEMAGLFEEGLPLVGWQTHVVPLGSRGFAPVVEKAVVVGGVLEGEDGSVDEGVEMGDVLYKRFRKIEIHVCECKGEWVLTLW